MQAPFRILSPGRGCDGWAERFCQQKRLGERPAASDGSCRRPPLHAAARVTGTLPVAARNRPTGPDAPSSGSLSLRSRPARSRPATRGIGVENDLTSHMRSLRPDHHGPWSDAAGFKGPSDHGSLVQETDPLLPCRDPSTPLQGSGGFARPGGSPGLDLPPRNMGTNNQEPLVCI